MGGVCLASAGDGSGLLSVGAGGVVYVQQLGFFRCSRSSTIETFNDVEWRGRRGRRGKQIAGVAL